MKICVRNLVPLFVLGTLMMSASVNAQQAVSPSITEAPAQATMHSDPIVQKRMEIREANRTRSAQTSKARKAYRKEARKARKARNQAAAQSRERARAALNQSQ